MTNNDNFAIGTPDYERKGGFGRKKWFYIKANEPNIYRVLPPVLSLARTGEYFKYHAVHRNMRASDGKQRAFLCIEDTDFNTKIVKVRCPVCDRRTELEAQYKALKESGQYSKEQLQEFQAAFVEPLRVERQYYMNVVDQSGEIGILPIASTLKKDMVETFKRLKSQSGIDAAGINGIFMNFLKVSQYKGDNKPVYKADPYMETINNPGGMPSMSYKGHQITPDFVEKMKAGCQDLTNIHRLLGGDQLAALTAADRVTRAKMLDELFKQPDNEEEAEGSTLSSSIPGVAGASTVSRVEIGANGAKVSTPVITAPVLSPGFPAAQQAPVAASPTAAFPPAAAAPQPSFTPPPAAPAWNPPPAQSWSAPPMTAAPAPMPTPAPSPTPAPFPQQGAAPAPGGAKPTMSDDEFHKLFMQGAKK